MVRRPLSLLIATAACLWLASGGVVPVDELQAADGGHLESDGSLEQGAPTGVVGGEPMADRPVRAMYNNEDSPGLDDEVSGDSYYRSTFKIPAVDGSKLHAWLFKPYNYDLVRDDKFPVTIMAHGFGLDKTFGLEPYARAFAEAGIAVVMFDYRTFGGSEGQPRGLISPFKHVEDYKSVLAFVAKGQADDQLDGSRIALWGTSFSGGHVLVAGAETPYQKNLKAIISQGGFMNANPYAGISPLTFSRNQKLMQIPALATQDRMAAMANRPPVYLQLYGDMDTLCFCHFSPAELSLFYEQLVPDPLQTEWSNKAPARAYDELTRYFPINYASRIRVPTLYIADNRDIIHPPDRIRTAASLTRGSTLLNVDANHMQGYTPEKKAIIVPKMVAFLVKALA